MSENNPHWSQEPYWTEAMDSFLRIRDSGQTKWTLDIRKIEEVAFREDGPAYKLMDAMLSVREHEGYDGFRGAPRVMLALLAKLKEISESDA